MTPFSCPLQVFLPGLAEIMTLHDQLLGHRTLGRRAGRFLLVPLHSSLSSEEQQLVFRWDLLVAGVAHLVGIGVT